MRISDWSSDVCSSDLPGEIIERDIPRAVRDDRIATGERRATERHDLRLPHVVETAARAADRDRGAAAGDGLQPAAHWLGHLIRHYLELPGRAVAAAGCEAEQRTALVGGGGDRKSTRLNSSH